MRMSLTPSAWFLTTERFCIPLNSQMYLCVQISFTLYRASKVDWIRNNLLKYLTLYITLWALQTAPQAGWYITIVLFFNVMVKSKSSQTESNANTRCRRTVPERLTKSQSSAYKILLMREAKTFVLNISLVSVKILQYVRIYVRVGVCVGVSAHLCVSARAFLWFYAP